MAAATTQCSALLLLLTLSGAAAAQTWPPAGVEDDARRDHAAPQFWTKAPDDAMQTFVGVRHNATDGTVVGLSLRPPGYPAFLLQVEVVPPGYGPAAEERDVSKPAPLAPESQALRSVHKLSLRYRF